MLKNAPLIAKIGVDTAEKNPGKCALHCRNRPHVNQRSRWRRGGDGLRRVGVSVGEKIKVYQTSQTERREAWKRLGRAGSGRTRAAVCCLTTTNFNLFFSARSPLYQRRFWRLNSHFSAFFEIYKICNPSHRSQRKKKIA